MGGHEHGHKIKIPSPDIYKVEDCPELIKLQETLAKDGLKDPWLRNEAWRHHRSRGTELSRLGEAFRGWKLGIPVFLICLGITELLAKRKEDHHDQGGHH